MPPCARSQCCTYLCLQCPLWLFTLCHTSLSFTFVLCGLILQPGCFSSLVPFHSIKSPTSQVIINCKQKVLLPLHRAMLKIPHLLCHPLSGLPSQGHSLFLAILPLQQSPAICSLSPTKFIQTPYKPQMSNDSPSSSTHSVWEAISQSSHRWSISLIVSNCNRQWGFTPLQAPT